MVNLKISNPAVSTLQGLLACPHCRQALGEDSSSESWVCNNCGKVARKLLGFPDFLENEPNLPAAAGGVFDLQADEACARKLARRADELSFNELRSLAMQLEGVHDEGTSKLKQRARERFNKNFAKMEEGIDVGAGEALLSKINPYLKDMGKPEVGGKYALEVGGGHGFFLPDFSRLFQLVVFLDCSLVNLVLARKLAEERKAHNIAFVRGDAHRLPCGSGVFDLVHENGIIEHVADPSSLIKEALRVRSVSGTYVCLSPNRFSLAAEPHFRLPAFGFFPHALRRPLIAWLRGISSEAGTDPRSLRQLRRYFADAGKTELPVFFLPRSLEFTARRTPFRLLMRATLALPGIGAVVSNIINGPLLWLMPYHIAVVSSSPKKRRKSVVSSFVK